MRTIALEYPELGKLEFVEEGQPRDPEPMEVLVETKYSGITNGTERHALMAEHFWGEFPSRHGYQQVGPVVAVGSAVQDLKPGDWTFNGDYVGHRGWNIINTAGPHLLIKLPPSGDYKKYALLGVAGVAMKGVRRFGVKPADKVLVIGIGPIGYFSAISAKVHGAEVTVTDLNGKRLKIAAEQGCDHAINVSDPKCWDKLRALGAFDYIIDGSGYGNLFFDICDNGLLAHGGAICPMAVRTEARFPWGMLHGTDGRIEVSCHFSLDDLRVLLYCIQSGAVNPEAIISHFVSINDAPRIYGIMRDNPAELFGVVFDWT